MFSRLRNFRFFRVVAILTFLICLGLVSFLWRPLGVHAATCQAMAPATCWYVDGSVSTSGDGTSWADAWKSFSDITGVGPGDFVYISGGLTSQTYTVNNWTPTGGSSGEPVTYAVGQDEGHNGVVTISSTNFLNGSINNVTIDGDVSGAEHWSVTTSGYFWEEGTGTNEGVTLSYITIPNMRGGFHWADVDNTDVEIDHCDIVKDNDYENIHDFIFYGGWGTSAGELSVHDNYIQFPISASDHSYGDDMWIWPGNVNFYNNTVKGIPRATYGSGDVQHSDLFQTNQASNVRVYNNTFIDPGESAFYEDSNGSDTVSGIYIYNNLIVRTLACNGGAQRIFDMYPEGSGVGTVKYVDMVIANNTIVDDSGSACNFGIRVSGAGTYTRVYVVNNLGFPSGGTDVTADDGVVVSNNYDDNTIDFVSYTSYGGTDNNLHLVSTDTAVIDQGRNMSAYFTTDKDGTSRPQGSAWDIGAYEFTSSSSLPTISSFSASPSSITSGASSTLSWTTTGATTVAINNSVGNETATSSGLATVSPTDTTTYTLSAVNSSGTSTAQTTVTVTIPDTTPPTLSSIASSTTETGAVITWTTNESADSKVVYGLSSSYGKQKTSATLVTSHSITLSSLSAGTLYHFAVVSADSSGNTATSSDRTFTTAEASDTTAPSTPTNLSATTISTSEINLSWSASTDANGVAGYTIYRDSTAVGTTSGTTYSDTGLAAGTAYTYKVAAYDAAGNVSSFSSAETATTQSASSGGGGGGGSSSSSHHSSSGGTTSTTEPMSPTASSTPVSIPPVLLPSLTTNLLPGMHSTDVATLQTMLINLGFLAPGNATGFYGPLTQAAVQSFQKAHAIISFGTPLTTGYGAMGPKTRAALNTLASSEGSSQANGSNAALIESLEAEIAQLTGVVQKLMEELRSIEGL